ncbi:MAG: DUF11 domain-containing protein, partial [Chloroflexi bacterium]|nr:DUF11 domain-containing protein [Chloroflexota bacterium]
MAKNEEQVEQVLRALAQDDVRAGDAFKRHLIATLQAHQQRTPFERFWHRLMRPLRQRWMVQWGLVAAMMIVICVGIVLMATPSRYIVLDVLHGQAEVTRSSPIIPWREETTSGAAGGRSISVAEGGHVQVDDESTAVLTFDGSEVTLSPGTQMTVTQARPRSVWQPPSVRMRVRTGEVYARVQSLRTRKGRFEVDMPAALVSVRGTVFRARVISPSHTYVATEEGVVAVTLNDPAQDYPSVDVPAGYEVDARVGQPLVVQPVGARPTTSELATSTVSSVTPDTPTDTPLSSPESMTVTRVPSPTDASSPTSSATETPTSTSALTGTTPTPSLADDADLGVDVLLENSDAIGAGQHLRYAIVVTNWGPATAENVMVTQTLPPAMRFISATLPPDRRTPALVWSLGSLGDDQTRVLDVEVYVYRWATGEVTMTAEIAADHSDGNARNNLVRVRTATTKAADLSITATVHPQQVSVGDVVTATLRYANRGPARAEDVKVQAELSPHMRFGGVVERGAATLIPSSVREVPEGTIIVGDAGGPRWDVGSMEVGDEGQIVFTATVQEEALGTLINTFSVVGYTFDEHKENDKQVVELSALREADLAISRTMTAGGGAVQAGDVITTTLHYVNRGPWEAQRVTITDALPDGVTFGGLVRASSDINWSLTSEEQHITWSAAALPADAHGTLVFTATVGFDAPSELVHQAHIASAMWDRTPDNNEMTHTT